MPVLPFHKNCYNVNQIILLNYGPYEYEYFSKSWGERNTAVTAYFGENEFFTKMNTIFNVTDSDKFLKLLYK